MKVGDLVQSISKYDTAQHIPGIIMHIKNTNSVFLKIPPESALYMVWFYDDEIHPYWEEELRLLSVLERR